MKHDHPARHFIAAFLLALVLYIAAYAWIEHRRTRKGPWEVSFTTNRLGNAALIIAQPQLGLTNVTLEFASPPPSPRTNATWPITFKFTQPKPVPFDLPFGKCIFMDTTFLPGTLTVSAFGHEIEMLPRTLAIDHQERRWNSGEIIRLK